MGKKKLDKKKQTKNKNKENNNNNNENTNNKVDFFLDDADADLAYDSSELESKNNSEQSSKNSDSLSEHGSDLDFNDEDYKSQEEEKKEKEFKMTKNQLKKLISKTRNGNEISITKIIILFSKITNPNSALILDENENILSKKNIISNIIKFCIEELPNIFLLKINKNNKNIEQLIKRYLSILIRYLKTCEETMKEFIINHLNILQNLIFLFKNFIEIFLKKSIEIWATTKIPELRIKIINFIQNLISSKPNFFELTIKIFYINYLQIAKSMNINSFQHIKQLQNDFINILNFDLQKSYITIFTFIRKLCIQLRNTIIDKTLSSIKNIYNWQFVNSLILWGRVIMHYVNDEDIHMLIYPLIQTIVGVVRLNSSENFYLLRIRLVILLNAISRVSGIFIPVAMYILPILKSNYFIEKCKNFNNDNNKNNKNKNNEKKVNLKNINNRVNIAIMIKIKKEEYKFKQIRKDLLIECCDCLIEFLSINSYRICIEELCNEIIKEIRNALKNIIDKEYREIIKIRLEKIENFIKFNRERLEKNKSMIVLTKIETIKNYENNIKLNNIKNNNKNNNNINDFYKEWENIRHRRQADFEAIKSQKENKFIEIDIDENN